MYSFVNQEFPIVQQYIIVGQPDWKFADWLILEHIEKGSLLGLVFLYSAVGVYDPTPIR